MYKPGKGARLTLTQSMLDFMQQAMADIDAAYDAQDVDDDNEKAIVTRLSETEGWTKTKDEFGTKVWKAMTSERGQVRVALVLTKAGNLRLDVRQWHEGE